MKNSSGQTKLVILLITAGVTVLLGLTSTVYQLTVKPLEASDRRIEEKADNNAAEIRAVREKYIEVLTRMDSRLANLEAAAGLKSQNLRDLINK
jgi:hypothetical protein